MPNLTSAALAQIESAKGVLQAVYEDLAAPGVRQVGKALETVLQCGNILLLPIRLLNHAAATFERKNFADIAKRFADIPDENVIEVPPEIGVPILEKLSITQDEDLRRLFVELLAKAADDRTVRLTHPSFMKVIENLSPDEARLLGYWEGKDAIPCLKIDRKGPGGSTIKVADVVVIIPDEIHRKDAVQAYIANLSGLGLISLSFMEWMSSSGAYDDIVTAASQEFGDIKAWGITESLSSGDQPAEGQLVYGRGIIRISGYGKMFIEACVR